MQGLAGAKHEGSPDHKRLTDGNKPHTETWRSCRDFEDLMEGAVLA